MVNTVRRKAQATAGLLAVFAAVFGSLGAGIAGGASGAVLAHAAHTARVTDEAHLRYIPSRSSGTRLFEEGTAHGALPGSMLANCSLGVTFKASFTIHVRGGGTITGTGTATPHGSGIYESFAGTLIITRGTGRYAHAHGHAGLYGTFNRRTYALVVQTTGTLSY